VDKKARSSQRARLAADLGQDDPIVHRSVPRIYKLSALVALITPENRHREADWGQPHGNECW
jgi:antitoxin component of MazEF toxin-antitoxin module